jgi:hypothetical protein
MKKQLKPFIIAFVICVGSSILARLLSDSGIITYTVDLVITLAVPILCMTYFVYQAANDK